MPETPTIPAPTFQRQNAALSNGGSENPHPPSIAWRGRNTRRGVLAALFAAGTCAAACAQSTSPAPAHPPLIDPAALVAPAPDFDPPAPSRCIDAFNTVSAWVRAWSVPERDAANPSDPDGTHAVCVTLRLSGATGRTLARSTFIATDANRGDLLRLAAKAALVEAEPKLKLDNDATRQTRLLETAARVLVDVQFAGRPVPLPGETPDEIALRLNPGRDGVLARAGANNEDAASSAVFPASMLSMNVTPGKAAEIAVGALRLPPLPLKELREKSGLEVYRFASRQVAQTVAAGPPEILFRGGRVIALQEMNAQGLRDFADAMSGHLRSHAIRLTGPDAAPLGLRGSYNPLTDTYTPPVAAPREQAVAALALARFARAPGVLPDSAQKSLEVAREILDQLTQVHPRENDPLASVTSAAAWVLADTEITAHHPPQAPPDEPRQQRLAQFRARALPLVRAAVTVNTPDAAAASSAVAEVVWSPGLAALERPMIACALARAAATPEEVDAARAVVRALMRDTPTGELVASMPWLGWAELELAKPDGAAPVPSAEALRQMRALCWSRQVTAEAAAADPDMAGGIVFTSGTAPGITAGFPTWHTIRPLAVLSTMLGDARLTGDDELQQEVLSLIRSLRFARQLAIDEDAAHMMRDPARALGGIRPAPWDQTASLDATSLTLLAVSEALTSADARSK